VAGPGRVWGLIGCGLLTQSDQSRKTWLWCHCGLTVPVSQEAAPDWPVAMAAWSVKQEEPGGRCPCLLWKTSPLSWASRYSRNTQLTLAHQAWRNQFFTC
jgi:hypothetical protein